VVVDQSLVVVEIIQFFQLILQQLEEKVRQPQVWQEPLMQRLLVALVEVETVVDNLVQQQEILLQQIQHKELLVELGEP
jgi:hypothetical protein